MSLLVKKDKTLNPADVLKAIDSLVNTKRTKTHKGSK